MATLKGVIAAVDEIKPNAFSDAAKTEWLNECEGLVQTEVMLLDIAECITYDAQTDAELLVRPPHDKLYRAYLIAMIDFAHVSDLGKDEVDQKLLVGIHELHRLLEELTTLVKGRMRPGRNQSLSPDLCTIDDISELQPN